MFSAKYNFWEKEVVGRIRIYCSFMEIIVYGFPFTPAINVVDVKHAPWSYDKNKPLEL
jgi:hypothetical protein